MEYMRLIRNYRILSAEDLQESLKLLSASYSLPVIFSLLIVQSPYDRRNVLVAAVGLNHMHRYRNMAATFQLSHAHHHLDI